MVVVFFLVGRLRELTKPWGSITQKPYLGRNQLIMKGEEAQGGLATQS